MNDEKPRPPYDASSLPIDPAAEDEEEDFYADDEHDGWSEIKRRPSEPELNHKSG